MLATSFCSCSAVTSRLPSRAARQPTSDLSVRANLSTMPRRSPFVTWSSGTARLRIYVIRQARIDEHAGRLLLSANASAGAAVTTPTG
jgi:hypothetical protein